MRNVILKLFFFFFPMFLIFACGQTSSTTTPVPTPPPPVEDDAPTDFSPAPPPVDPRLPDLSKAVALNLKDKTLKGLKDLAVAIFPPLVGDPLILMDFSNGRGTEVEGSVLLSFEDAQGFWGARLDSVSGVGTRSADTLDMIFADDEFVLRIVGALSTDIMNGTVFYRLRAIGENQCKRPVLTCEIYYDDPTLHGYPPGVLPPIPPECNEPPAWIAPCRAYMNLSDSHVKELGSFKATQSEWAY